RRFELRQAVPSHLSPGWSVRQGRLVPAADPAARDSLARPPAILTPGRTAYVALKHLAKKDGPKILRRMTKRRPATAEPLFLGIECGGTRTSFVIAEDEPTVFWQGRFGPANLRLLSDPELTEHFQAICHTMPQPAAIAIGMAGARTEADRERIRRAAANVWPGVPCHATNDLETALAAAETVLIRPPSAARSNRQHAATCRVLILSGTGSCCFGQNPNGRTAKVGGWGHILGDKGSGFEIGLRALKAVVYYQDTEGEWSELGRRILRKLQVN